MNLPLDTHTLIWVFDGGKHLAKEAIGKLRLQGDYLKGLIQYRFTPLDMPTEHSLGVEQLPDYHKDPFDCLLIAQAQLEKLTLVTRDTNIMKYAVSTLSA